MNKVPAAVVITDIKGNIEYANPVFAELTGYSIEEAIGKTSKCLKNPAKPHQRYTRSYGRQLRPVTNGVGSFVIRRRMENFSGNMHLFRLSGITRVLLPISLLLKKILLNERILKIVLKLNIL